MKNSFWGYMVIALGVIAIGIIWFIANSTRTDQHNFYLLREAVESAMIESVELGVWEDTGEVQIDEALFLENLLRRFANSADLSNTYVFEIYDISTKPPKVSLKVSSASNTSATGEIVTFNMVNNIDAILETTYTNK